MAERTHKQLDLGYETPRLLPVDQRGYAVLLGAGFSKWAAGLPLLSELFDFAVQPWGVREASRQERLRQVKADWDVAHPGDYPEEFVAYALAAGGKTARDMVWYIARRLLEGFIESRMPYSTGRRTFAIGDGRGPVHGTPFLRHIMSCRGIITTNYDLLVEYALGPKGFNYGIPGEVLRGYGIWPHASPCHLTGLIPLAKVHGSVSWEASGSHAVRRGSFVGHTREVPEPATTSVCRPQHYFDGRCGITGKALIVAPTPDKAPPPDLQPEWELARLVLASSRRVVVFGFAFNPYDEAILNLLNTAQPRVEAALLVDTSPPVERCRSVWPEAEITVAAPPPDGDGAIRKWLQTAASG
jgi:hypothetical protein